MKQFIAESWKAILAFLGVFVSVLLTRLTDDQAGVLPGLDDVPAWLALIGGCVGTALMVYAKRNRLNADQVSAGFADLERAEQRAVIDNARKPNPA